jgi:polyphosphate kinase 2 (PPK2 family)
VTAVARDVVPSPYLAPFDGDFDIADSPTAPPDDAPGKKEAKKQLEAHVARIAELQPILHAHDRHALLVILKFFLNVSREEQRRRFLSRLEEPHKHWKFSANDVRERGYWSEYMHAYEDALRATSRRHAPWYAIPADDKPFMRMAVAGIIAERLASLSLR